MFPLLAILTWPSGVILPPVLAVVGVLAGDGVFATARTPPTIRSPVERLTTTPWGSLLRPTATPQPAVKNFWGMPSLGVEFEFSASRSPFRKVWGDLGPLRPTPDSFAITHGQFNFYVG